MVFVLDTGCVRFLVRFFVILRLVELSFNQSYDGHEFGFPVELEALIYRSIHWGDN